MIQNKNIQTGYQIDDFTDPFIINHPISETQFQGSYHIHNDYYEFYLFLQSKGFFYNDGAKYPLRPGDFIIIPPDKIHRAYTTDHSPYERVILHLSRKTLIEISSPITNLHNDIQSCSGRMYHFENKGLKSYIDLAGELMKTSFADSPAFGQDLLQRSYLSILLIQMIRMIRESSNEVFSSPPSMIRDVYAYIDQHLSEDISIQSIANAMNISRSYLCHQFREYFNTSLWNYVLSKRLILAQKLLLSGSSVTEACYDSGFRDYAHFIKSFTKTFGVPPKKYSMNPAGQKTVTLPC